jgi:F-type H+-transporting ATPase subunit gamma
MALKDVKAKISATNRMNKVTRAMEAVSAVKMRTTQMTALGGRAYARAALSILARLSGTLDMKQHPLALMKEGNGKIALIVITSDKGLAGALNSSALKAAAEAIAGYPKESIIVYAVGRKAEEYFSRRGYMIGRAFENKRDDVPLSYIEELAQKLTAAFTHGEFGQVITAYSRFKSTFEQVPTARRLLPLSVETVQELVNDIIPVKGKWSDERELPAPTAYNVEPSADIVLDALVPRFVAVSLYHMLLESKASEHSARMVAMKNASDKSKEVARDLTRRYNRIRQAAITREVSEIVGGQGALASS